MSSPSARIKQYLRALQCRGFVSVLNPRKFSPLGGMVVVQDLGGFYSDDQLLI